MENKIINAIKYIKFIIKKRHGEGTWETEGLMTSLWSLTTFWKLLIVLIKSRKPNALKKPKSQSQKPQFYKFT